MQLRRNTVIALLGFSSGLPLALTAGTLKTWFADQGVDVTTIGWLTLVGQPYVYKFLWAPVLDAFSLSRLGRRRSWLMVSQLGVVLGLLMMASLQPLLSPWRLVACAVLVSFLSATQDIAVDAYRAEITPPEERGLAAALGTAGYRVAMLVSGGLAMMLADNLGWPITYLVMAALMTFGMVATVFAREPVQLSTQPPLFRDMVREPLTQFFDRFGRDTALAIVALVICYKLCDALVGSLSNVFLLEVPGFSLTELGVVKKSVELLATMMGVLVGGWMLLRLNLAYALLWFGIGQALTNLLFLVLAHVGHHMGLLLVTVFAENFIGGMGSTAFLALLMSLCEPRFAATQFALLTALSAVGRVYVGPVAGYVVAHMGWSWFFIWSAAMGIPSLCLLAYLKPLILRLSEANGTAVERVSMALAQ